MPEHDAFTAYQSGQFDLAYKLVYPLAVDGNREAQSLLGSLFQLGLGTTRDLSAAQYWYGLSSSQGCSVASNNLAGMLKSEGRLIDSERYYALARQQGFVHTPESPTLEGMGQPA